jgi:hypothetical protein
VLEFFAPPPSTGSSGAYARTRPYVDTFAYAQHAVLGRWPMDRAAIEAADRMTHLTDRDLRWRLEGPGQTLMVGLCCATEHLTAGKAMLLPGQVSGRRSHAGDLSLYVTEGHLNLLAPDPDGPRWFDAGERDGLDLPAGTPYEFSNMTDAPVSFVFGVAPDCRASV